MSSPMSNSSNQLTHEIRIRAEQPVVLEALTTIDGLQGWHTASVTGSTAVGADIEMAMPNSVRFVWRVLQSDNDGVQWQCLSGPGTSPGTSVRYELSLTDDGRTLVRMVHEGWSGDSENFDKCNTLWGALLFHLKSYCETGSAKPAI